MDRNEYLKDAFKKYNEGKISAEAYDAILENIDAFCEDEENENKLEENQMNKNLYVFENHIYEVIDETQTHYVCSPKNNNEGYGYIPKEKGFSLEIHEKLFNLSNRNLEEIKKYNQWIAKEGYFDYGIFVCSECNKYIFGQGEQEEHLCEECKDKDNFYVLIKYSDGYFLSRIFKRYQEAHSTMKAEVEKEASYYYKDLNELPYDDIVVCEDYKGFVAGNVSQEDTYWEIQTFNINQIIK